MTFKTNLTKSRKIINFLLFVLFLVFAILQLNDPDPTIWVLVYGLVAIISLISNFKNIPRWLIGFLAFSLLLYSSIHFPSLLEYLKTDKKAEIFGEMVYDKPYLEGSREFLGLIIAVIGLLYQFKKVKS